MSQQELEEVLDWRAGRSKAYSPSRSVVKHMPNLESIDEITGQTFTPPALPLIKAAVASPRSPSTTQSPKVTRSTPYSPARSGLKQSSPRLEALNEQPPTVELAMASETEDREGGSASWHLNHPLPISPATAATSNTTTTTPTAQQHLKRGESIRESLMSRDSVISSRRLKSQFVIELAVRFAMLTNLKVLDQGIDARHLEIGEKLGGGTFGTVCKAKLRGLDVAVKQLNSGTLNAESTLALKIEVEILSKLRHPNIVLFIGLSLTPTFAAMVTEWCERGSLFDMLKSPTDRLCAKTMLKLALDIARGMWYLHSSEKLLIIHRDLKSPNVLISLGGSAKVADFGLAVMHERSDVERSGVDGHEFHGNAGTPQWMAPEIMRREAYGQKVDIYSFGILMTEMLTRRMPYRDKYKDLDFKEAVLEKNERPTIPAWATSSKGAASESQKLGELVMECTEMNPTRRPDFSQVIDTLESLFFTLEHNEIRAFEDYDLPRWLEALDCGDFDEVVHASYEMKDVLEDVLAGKALLSVEKKQVLAEHAREMINASLCRVGFGKAAKLKEEGAEYDYEPLPPIVMTNLILSMDLSLRFLRASNVKLHMEVSPISTPSIKPYQIETLMDLFLDTEDEDSELFRALIRILQSDLIGLRSTLKRAVELKLDERIVGVRRVPSLINLSGESTFSSSQSSVLSTDEVLESKDDLAQQQQQQTETNRQGVWLDKCKRHGLPVPAKYQPQSDRFSRAAEALKLEEEIAKLEATLALRKQQLEELRTTL